MLGMAITAGQNTRLYGGAPQPIDGLLPATLTAMFPDNYLYASRRMACESMPAPRSGLQ